MKVAELAGLIDGVVEGDHDIEIASVNSIEKARSGDLTFAMDDERLASAEASGASCILVSQCTRDSSTTLIRVQNPQLAFVLSYHALHGPEDRGAFIHPTAVIADSVILGNHVWVGPHVVIENGVVIGNQVIIEANTVIKKNCRIGALCRLCPNVTLYDSVELQKGVVLHSGVVVGSDGFGYVKDKGQVCKLPQLGKVVIEDGVEIGANTTIDRGSLNDTVIGAGTKIDNLCQVAHNVRIGRNTLIAAQCGISGSTVIGDDVTMGGQTGIADHVTIGNNVTIGGKAGVTGNLRAGSVVWGIPARPVGEVKRQIAVLSWLAKHFDRLSKLMR